MPTAQPGISVVICCYNSATRLPRTLSHLMAQKVSRALPWEVLVVDNASTDDTADVARDCWRRGTIPLRVLHERRPGQKFARELGIAEARYEFVSFVDDDNWLADDWIETVAGFFAEHPDVAAVGGSSTPALDGDLPDWFSFCQALYAISLESWAAGERTPDAPPWGAGLTVRRSAWLSIAAEGTPFLTSGRLNNSLAAGEDTELCHRLVMAGWKLWYEPRLRFQHYLPEARLTWTYARRLCRGAGQASAILAPYEVIWRPPDSAMSALRQSWEWKLLTLMVLLLLHPWKLLQAALHHCEGDQIIPAIELLYGRLSTLARRRSAYYRARGELTQLLARLRSKDLNAPAMDAEPQASGVSR